MRAGSPGRKPDLHGQHLRRQRGDRRFDDQLWNEKSTGLVDDTDPGWKWNEWGQYTDSGAKGGSAHGGEGAVGAGGEYEFTGTGVGVYAWKGGDGGEVEVFLDGRSQSTFSLLYDGDELYDQLIFSASGLPQGKHTIKITAVNDGWCMVDISKSSSED